MSQESHLVENDEDNFDSSKQVITQKGRGWKRMTRGKGISSEISYSVNCLKRSFDGGKEGVSVASGREKKLKSNLGMEEHLMDDVLAEAMVQPRQQL